MDFISIDFETAASENNSACSVGIACVDELEIVHSEYYLIQPPSLVFAKKNISIHGIRPEDVQDEPKFPIIWEKIMHYFDGSKIVFAHNARFDMSVLIQCLLHYNLELPDFEYCCSIPFSTKICGGSVPRTLDARAAYFDIAVDDHHNAKSDAVTCAQIVAETVKRSRQKTFASFCSVRAIDFRSFLSLNPSKSLGKTLFEDIDYASAVPTDDICQGSVFSGKIVVITGEFERYTRKELVQQFVNRGALIKNAVGKKTDYLVCGKQDKSIVGEDGLSGKQEKAIALNEAGANIQILTDTELYSLFEAQ